MRTTILANESNLSNEDINDLCLHYAIEEPGLHYISVSSSSKKAFYAVYRTLGECADSKVIPDVIVQIEEDLETPQFLESGTQEVAARPKRDLYAIHKAIARNATLTYHEPGDDGEDVAVTKTCSQIILIGIERAERNPFNEGMLRSVNDMIVDYIAAHWAEVDPEEVVLPLDQFLELERANLESTQLDPRGGIQSTCLSHCDLCGVLDYTSVRVNTSSWLCKKCDIERMPELCPLCEQSFPEDECSCPCCGLERSLNDSDWSLQ